MRKLSQKKVRWIIREMEKGEISAYQIAKIQKVSQRWVWKLYRRYRKTGKYPYPKRPGRKPSSITDEEREYVKSLKEKHPLSGAITLEHVSATEGRRMPHNRLHRILKDAGLAKDEPKKQRMRKYIRWQRKHSNSLWHTDTFEHGENDKDMVLYEDDASRFMLDGKPLTRNTSKNCTAVLDKAVKNYGIPKQCLSDRGIQFTSSPREDCPEPGPNEFQKYLKKHEIVHIKARVKHPQTNGKMERAGGTIRKLIKHFGSTEKAMDYYNFKRPHWSLNLEDCETPFQAYIRKMRPAKKRTFVVKNRELVAQHAPKYLKFGRKIKK